MTLFVPIKIPICA